MPLMSAEFKARMSVNATAASRYMKGDGRPDSGEENKPPPREKVRKGPTLGERAAMSKGVLATAMHAVGKLMTGGGIDDEDANPMDRMAAMRLVDAGLWEAKEVDALFRAFNKIRAKEGHRKKAKDPTRLPTIADFYRYFRLESSVFCTQVLLLPKRVPLEGIPVEEVEKMELTFAEFALSTWLLCAFELATGQDRGARTRLPTSRDREIANRRTTRMADGARPREQRGPFEGLSTGSRRSPSA